ncbi:hypothetical protein TanjilG_07990 [Lupinus angustifolius]|uniref:Cysteine-rich transmembrane CYSTM domain-containing protein n=1 Tax=Lupinus angustifolius TaxID=3871 RepID=A0A4P1RME1_LUPAN|nr:hypothetical protein TanjilG_07990 [Lupinus angustifolius]
MSEIKYGYPYPAQGPYQGPPPVAAPPQYYVAPQPKRSPAWQLCVAVVSWTSAVVTQPLFLLLNDITTT